MQIPEIEPKLARATREDVIMATGRSDYPNQVPYSLRCSVLIPLRALQNAQMKR